MNPINSSCSSSLLIMFAFFFLLLPKIFHKIKPPSLQDQNSTPKMEKSLVSQFIFKDNLEAEYRERTNEGGEVVFVVRQLVGGVHQGQRCCVQILNQRLHMLCIKVMYVEFGRHDEDDTNGTQALKLKVLYCCEHTFSFVFGTRNRLYHMSYPNKFVKLKFMPLNTQKMT